MAESNASENRMQRLRYQAQQLVARRDGPIGYLNRALRSAAYPLQGIWYFSRRREYWPLFVGRLLPLSLISFFVYTILFTFTYLPQVAFLAIWQGRAAFVSAVFLVLGEGLVVIQGLFEGFFVDECRVDCFDVSFSCLPLALWCNADSSLLQAVLLDHGLIDLIAPQRLLFLDAPNSVKKLGKPTSSAAYTPWSIVQIAELIICLPLNFIPYVGFPAFVMITGTRLGKLAHYRWYKLRGLNRKEQKAEITSRSWEYVWFGTMAMILELIPVLSLFFLLTSTTGSALWVVDMEEAKRRENAAPDGAVAAQEEGVVYRDEPTEV
jgi:hypothetical protein